MVYYKSLNITFQLWYICFTIVTNVLKLIHVDNALTAFSYTSFFNWWNNNTFTLKQCVWPTVKLRLRTIYSQMIITTSNNKYFTNPNKSHNSTNQHDKLNQPQNKSVAMKSSSGRNVDVKECCDSDSVPLMRRLFIAPRFRRAYFH